MESIFGRLVLYGNKQEMEIFKRKRVDETGWTKESVKPEHQGI